MVRPPGFPLPKQSRLLIATAVLTVFVVASRVVRQALNSWLPLPLDCDSRIPSQS